MKASRIIGFYQILISFGYIKIQIHKLKTFKLYSQNKLFTVTSGFFIFKGVFSVFPESGLGIKKLRFIHSIFINNSSCYRKAIKKAMSQVNFKIPICKVGVAYYRYSQVKNMH